MVYQYFTYEVFRIKTPWLEYSFWWYVEGGALFTPTLIGFGVLSTSLLLWNRLFGETIIWQMMMIMFAGLAAGGCAGEGCYLGQTFGIAIHWYFPFAIITIMIALVGSLIRRAFRAHQ